MSITMTPEAEAKIQARVGSGRYANADEVIAEALRLLDEDERLQWPRTAVAEGLEGETVPLTRASWMEAWERAKTWAGIAETSEMPPIPANAPA